MVVPLDGIRAIHNAFRKDIQIMDAAARDDACGNSTPTLLFKRYKFFNEILVWHAQGEEEFVFPALEKVAPLLAEPYERDHRGLDDLYDRLDRAVNKKNNLEISRATAALDFHLQIHLNKEEAHLYKIFDQRLQLAEQGPITGKMAQKIPPDRFPEVIAWLYPLIGTDDKENMIRIWQQNLPGAMFANFVPMIKTAVGTDWEKIVERIPELK